MMARRRAMVLKFLFNYVVDAMFEMPVRYPSGDGNMQLYVWV